MSAATETAASLMTAFAERTGLSSDRLPRRYLWTDAFAVCNFLELARRTGEARWTELAFRTIDRVHAVLGRHRPDDPRKGWLSGLAEREGAEHPTRGGLRIGKPLPERKPGEPFDEDLEWELDGQYFHYLTKWMRALLQASGATLEPRFRSWARELAEAAHAAFVRGPPGARRMVWKMSCDLSRPLVPSTGQHDPLEGFLACLELLDSSPQAALERALAEYATLLQGTALSTDDPLGLGGLLADADRLAQLMERGRDTWAVLFESLLDAAAEGLARFPRRTDLSRPASQRLAFRELGLALGLSTVPRLLERVRADPKGLFRRPGIRARLESLLPKAALGPAIVSFWLVPEHQGTRLFEEHRDIDEVMLATCLVPEGFLDLPN